ncbi:MAG TPA: hypothetical protein VFA56_12395, partial [Gaiellaceae bacterium]|nr:hypothetical protein [Gaiellaceae bacterium]
MAGLSVRVEGTWNPQAGIAQDAVALYVSVTHNDGSPLTGLTERDFAVWVFGAISSPGSAVKREPRSFQNVQPGMSGGPVPEGVYTFGISSKPTIQTWTFPLFPILVEVTSGADRGRGMMLV